MVTRAIWAVVRVNSHIVMKVFLGPVPQGCN